ncbi:MAG: ATP-binding protein [Lentisphaeria bacterium]
MKTRDKVLFGMPLLLFLFVAVFGLFLYWQVSAFEHSYIAEVKDHITQETALIKAVIFPMLEDSKVENAVRFCTEFDSDNIRITLIESNGKVAADSFEKASLLANHLKRKEVQFALEGIPGSSSRYSESLNRWMMYYAIPLKTSSGFYVLRTAVSTDRVHRVIDFFRLNMLGALLFGGGLVFVLVSYIMKQVRKPMIRLSNNVDHIANGELSTQIEIPKSGIIRDLAVGILRMTECLKLQLHMVTDERNQRKSLFDSMSEGVLLLRSDGKVLQFNPMAASIFCFGESGRFHLNRCHIPKLVELSHEIFETKKPFEQEFVVFQQHVERSLYIRGRLLMNHGEEQLLLTVADLTSLRKLESFRSDFVANVSHEIKTPLTCIMGAVEVLEAQGTDITAEHREKLLEILKKQSMRLNSLIQDILRLAALENQQAAIHKEFMPIALDSVLANAANLCMEKVAEKKMALTIVNKTSLEMEGDSFLLEQALVNLIINAVKYSGGSHIELSLTQQMNDAVITVKDDGIGIDDKDQLRLFERFYRVDKSRSREGGGTGLGLAIVKHTIQLHGGSIRVESAPGGGCLFRIRLPLEAQQ